MGKYQIYASLTEDMNSGYIWITDPHLSTRTIIQVNCKDTGKKIWCESRHIDDNFIRLYNQGTRYSIVDSKGVAVMSAWYRRLLGITSAKRSEFELDITSGDNPYGKIRACLQHPDNVVRIATYLGITSVLLGFIGLTLGIISLAH